MNGNCYFSEGLNPTLTCNKNEGNRVAIPVLTPDRAEKRQNGRRFKEDGEESFTLTAQDRHGVAVEVNPEVIGGIGEKNFGKQYREGNRIYDGDKIATALKASNVGNTGGATNLYSVDVTGFNATKNSGGHDEHGTCSECQRLQGSIGEQSDDDGGGDVFAIDKGYTPKEREIANCIESREDRGLSRRNQEGTLICHKIT